MFIASIYVPNRNPQPGPKFKYKLTWMKRLLAHAAELYALDAPVVLAGDFNVVPTDSDIYPTKTYANDALVQPEPRALFRRIAMAVSNKKRRGQKNCSSAAPLYRTTCGGTAVADSIGRCAASEIATLSALAKQL